MAIGMIGMHAHGDGDLGMAAHLVAHARPVLEIHRYAEHVLDAVASGRVEVGLQGTIGVREVQHVEMAMGVDQHGKPWIPACAGMTKTD
jgi:hypothetical protein